MTGWGVFLLALLLLLILGGVGWILYSHYRARRLGLPPPSLNPFARKADSTTYRAPAPAPSGIQGWLAGKWNALRNKRTAGGAYESTGYGGANGGSARDRRAFGPLDPDEAWDARVGNEADYGAAYYEEQELGLQDPGHGPYGGRGYGEVGVAGIEHGRGRSRSRQRELDDRYEAEAHGGGAKQNPFGDEAEASSVELRAASPRPVVDTQGTRAPSAPKKQQTSLATSGSAENSPTERRSAFREDVG